MAGKRRGTISCRVPKVGKSCWVLGPGKKKGSYNQSIESKGGNPSDEVRVGELSDTGIQEKAFGLSTGVKVSHWRVLHRKVT